MRSQDFGHGETNFLGKNGSFGWVNPLVTVLLLEDFSSVLCCTDEFSHKNFVVIIRIQVFLGVVELIKLGNGVVVLGYFSKNESFFVELFSVDCQRRLSMLVFLKLGPHLLSFIPVIFVEGLAEQVPLMVHLRNLIVKLSLGSSLN